MGRVVQASAKGIRETLGIRGDLTVVVRRASDRRVLKRFTLINTITYDGSNSPLFLWAQDGVTVTDYQIAQLRAGTSTTPPTRGDINLGAPFSGNTIALSSANRSVATATGELVITAQFDTTMANGFTLSEAGLFTGNNKMFSRQIHPAVPKTSAITVSYSWRIATTST